MKVDKHLLISVLKALKRINVRGLRQIVYCFENIKLNKYMISTLHSCMSWPHFSHLQIHSFACTQSRTDTHTKPLTHTRAFMYIVSLLYLMSRYG